MRHLVQKRLAFCQQYSIELLRELGRHPLRANRQDAGLLVDVHTETTQVELEHLLARRMRRQSVQPVQADTAERLPQLEPRIDIREHVRRFNVLLEHDGVVPRRCIPTAAQQRLNVQPGSHRPACVLHQHLRLADVTAARNQPEVQTAHHQRYRNEHHRQAMFAQPPQPFRHCLLAYKLRSPH
ncbi:hypothetical protein BamMEX5DRAFT_6314 [Burkholderia ambifaria MEX-5]|uniref:Uncharacterized protein n=1 Tax=Burkholderia ambifaria MEX-5 TaxID=396597 RepID=B1TEU8_9BURK|nr:hypothetical protein BamMEX5DRAFT_6314 [Burkholderia ambifaria MEX-5]